MYFRIIPREGSGNPGVSADEDWAVLNAKFRRVAMGYPAWANGHHPEGLRRLLLGQIGLGSDKRERNQRSMAAQSRLRGTKERRNDRLPFIGRLMIEPKQWVHLSPDVMTVRHRSLTFRLLAPAGNTVHALLQVPHGQFPFRLFTILSDPIIGRLEQGLPELFQWCAGQR